MKASYTVKVKRTMAGLQAELPKGNARNMRDAVLSKCIDKHNGFMTITVATPHRPRSTGKGSQCAHFNGHVQTIANDTGQPFDDVKKYLKHAAIDMGYPILSDNMGSPIKDMWGNIQGISEADASVLDSNKLIESAHIFAASYGIILVEGNDEGY